MPLPLLFIGIAAAAGSTGIMKTIKAGVDTSKAKHVNQSANDLVESASDLLNRQRLVCGKALERLGEEKLYVLSSTVTSFLETFTKIKNVDFRDSELRPVPYYIGWTDDRMNRDLQSMTKARVTAALVESRLAR